VVSKDKYYERKAAGLCTKCGKSREGSPSQARCLDCHTKLKTTQEAKKAQESTEKRETQKETIAALKNNSVLSKITHVPKICSLCGESIASFNLFCQKCIKATIFTKIDAIGRYGSVCSTCNEKDPKKLKIVSSDMSNRMKSRDQDLFKQICYRRVPPPEYRVQCYVCYWAENTAYIRGLKQIFKQKGVFEEFIDNDEDVIDVAKQ